jgi:hypothetical protein
MLMPVQPMQPVYKQTNHALHLILTLITFGCWSFVWIGAAIVTSIDNKNKQQWYEQALAYYAQQMSLYSQVNRQQWQNPYY